MLGGVLLLTQLARKRVLLGLGMWNPRARRDSRGWLVVRAPRLGHGRHVLVSTMWWARLRLKVQVQVGDDGESFDGYRQSHSPSHCTPEGKMDFGSSNIPPGQKLLRVSLWIVRGITSTR